jgi:hypothetical protein
MTNHREGSSWGKGSGFWGIDFATWLVNASVSENGIDCAICEIPKGKKTIRSYSRPPFAMTDILLLNSLKNTVNNGDIKKIKEGQQKK